MASIIQVENLNFQYKRGTSPALTNINFDIADGEFVGITGPAGAGKTTLLSCINGIIPHYYGGDLEGTVTLDGLTVAESNFLDMAGYVGTVFEDPDFQMVSISVEEEVAFGPENLGIPPDEIAIRVTRALEKTGISDLRNRSISTLSGGQKQRVAISAVLSMQPRVLLLDEPTSELDPLGTLEVFSVLRELNKESGMTVVIISQDIEALAEHVDRLMLLDHGEIKMLGPIREICMQREELESAGMRIPHVADLAITLSQELGLTLDAESLPLTTEQAIPFLKSILEAEKVL